MFWMNDHRSIGYGSVFPLKYILHTSTARISAKYCCMVLLSTMITFVAFLLASFFSYCANVQALSVYGGWWSHSSGNTAELWPRTDCMVVGDIFCPLFHFYEFLHGVGYMGGRGDGRQYPLAFSPPLEVPAVATIRFDYIYFTADSLLLDILTLIKLRCLNLL